MMLFILCLIAVTLAEDCKYENVLSNWECAPARRIKASYERALDDNFVSAPYQDPSSIGSNISALFETFSYLGDLSPKVAKITHSVGAFGVVEIEWEESNYTGLFHGTSELLIRFSGAAGPPFLVAPNYYFFLPNIALKQFRKGTYSGTLQFSHTGFDPTGHAGFMLHYSNHFQYKGSDFDRLFELVAPPTATGLCDFAKRKANGQEVDDADVRCPWALVLQPNPLLVSRYNNSNTSFLGQLYDTINVNDEIFKIYYVNTAPVVSNGTIRFATPTLAGSMKLKEKLIPTMWGDGQSAPNVGGGFFLNHKSFAYDYNFNPSFLQSYLDTRRYEDVTGYIPLLPTY